MLYDIIRKNVLKRWYNEKKHITHDVQDLWKNKKEQKVEKLYRNKKEQMFKSYGTIWKYLHVDI